MSWYHAAADRVRADWGRKRERKERSCLWDTSHEHTGSQSHPNSPIITTCVKRHDEMTLLLEVTQRSIL